MNSGSAPERQPRPSEAESERNTCPKAPIPRGTLVAWPRSRPVAFQDGGRSRVGLSDGQRPAGLSPAGRITSDLRRVGRAYDCYLHRPASQWASLPSPRAVPSAPPPPPLPEMVKEKRASDKSPKFQSRADGTDRSSSPALQSEGQGASEAARRRSGREGGRGERRQAGV